MFNNDLKKIALKIHEESLEDYKAVYILMQERCDQLYTTRTNTVFLIKEFEKIINSIANTPKEFGTKMGETKKHLQEFHKTEEYAKESFEEAKKAGKQIGATTAAGVAVASMAPTMFMSFATTFGTASTGTAISTLSGIAAEKAAKAWLGRTFASFAVKSGAGMAAGEAFLALAGPVGWGITAVSTGWSLISLTKKNKEISDMAVEEAKEIEKARESLLEITARVTNLRSKTEILACDLNKYRKELNEMYGMDYITLSEDKKLFLGSIVNNMLSLSELINKTV